MLILVLSRSIDSAINLLESNGFSYVSPAIKYFIIWIVANCFLQGSMGMYPSILPKGLVKFYLKWSQMTRNDVLLTEVW